MNKTGKLFAPFTLIAMKDVKDKNSKGSNKGDLRPLFDCVTSLANAVDDVKTYIQSSPEEHELTAANEFLKQLTQMQIQLLQMTASRVETQNMAPLNKPTLDEKPEEAQLPVEAPVETLPPRE